MGLEKAKVFLQKHPELEAFIIYSDEQGKYKYYKTDGIKNIIEFKE
jgi:thiamine biosynthesis lipoprotein